MPAITVVEVLDVVGDGHGQFELRGPTLSIQQFDLHRSPKRLHRRIVVAVAYGSHRSQELELTDVLTEAPGRKLRPVVGMYHRRR